MKAAMTDRQIIEEAKKRYYPIQDGDRFDNGITLTNNVGVHKNIDEWSVIRGSLYSMPYMRGGYRVFDGFNWMEKINKNEQAT